MGKPNIILLHGALGSVQQLQPLAEILSVPYHVHMFNFQGHGTEPSGAFGIEAFSEQLAVFIRTNGLSNVPIFGYSMGGYVALNYFIQHPENTAKLVTLGTKFAWTLESAQKEVAFLNPSFLEEKVPAYATKLQQLHSGIGWKNLLQKTADMMLSLGKNPLLTANNLAAVNNEVLVCVGGADKMVSNQESEAYSSYLKNGFLRVLPSVEHPIEKAPLATISQMLQDQFFI